MPKSVMAAVVDAALDSQGMKCGQCDAPLLIGGVVTPKHPLPHVLLVPMFTGAPSSPRLCSIVCATAWLEVNWPTPTEGPDVVVCSCGRGGQHNSGHHASCPLFPPRA